VKLLTQSQLLCKRLLLKINRGFKEEGKRASNRHSIRADEEIGEALQKRKGREEPGALKSMVSRNERGSYVTT
jgi:hypothetical protein